MLVEMGIDYEYARGTLRLSVGKYTTDSEIITASRILSDAANRLWEGSSNVSPKRTFQKPQESKISPAIAWNKPKEVKGGLQVSPSNIEIEDFVKTRHQVVNETKRSSNENSSPPIPRYMRQTRSSFNRISKFSSTKTVRHRKSQSKPRIMEHQSKIPLIPFTDSSPSSSASNNFNLMELSPTGTPNFRLSLRADIDEAVEKNMTPITSEVQPQEMTTSVRQASNISNKRDYRADGFGSEDWKSDFDRVLARTRAALLQAIRWIDEIYSPSRHHKVAG